MEDVTDAPFRRLVATWGRPGPDIAFTEFTRVDAPTRILTRHGAAALASPAAGRMHVLPGEPPVVPQLWGTRPAEFADAAWACRELGCVGIDLNMGCPARKIRRAGACSALMTTPRLAAEIISATRSAGLPVSVKTRIGLSEPIAERWCAFLLEQGLAALTVHPRTADQMSDDWADWRVLRRVVALRDRITPATVIVGNGDVRSLVEAERRVAQTGVDGVMIGRAIFADPELFGRRGEPSQPTLAPEDPAAAWREQSLAARLGRLAEHVHLWGETWGDGRPFDILKRFVKVYLPHRAESAMRDRIYACRSVAEAESAVTQILAARPAPPRG